MIKIKEDVELELITDNTDIVKVILGKNYTDRDGKVKKDRTINWLDKGAIFKITICSIPFLATAYTELYDNGNSSGIHLTYFVGHNPKPRILNHLWHPYIEVETYFLLTKYEVKDITNPDHYNLINNSDDPLAKYNIPKTEGIRFYKEIRAYVDELISHIE